MTGFEPATTRPPDVYSTGLSYIPKMQCKDKGINFNLQERIGKTAKNDDLFCQKGVFLYFYFLNEKIRNSGMGICNLCMRIWLYLDTFASYKYNSHEKGILSGVGAKEELNHYNIVLI